MTHEFENLQSDDIVLEALPDEVLASMESRAASRARVYGCVGRRGAVGHWRREHSRPPEA